MAAERSWEMGWYESRDKPRILALNRIEYGNVALGKEEYLDWLRDGNPVGRAEIPVARNRETREVVGFAFSVPLRVVCYGRELVAFVAMNILVDRAFRGPSGAIIFLRIMRMIFADAEKQGFAFGYTFPNILAVRATRRLGGEIVTPAKLVVRPLDIHALTWAARSSNLSCFLVRWGVNLGWGVAGTTFWRERRPASRDMSLRIVQDTGFDESYDRFWERVKTKYRVMLVRDRQFLQWRFCAIPHRTYHILSARQGGEILGYIVLRQAEIRQIPTGLIADLVVVPGERGSEVGLHLVREATRRFRQAGLSLGGALILAHTHEYAILRRAGYVPCPDRFAPGLFHLCVKSFPNRVPMDLLARPEGWHVTIADHDAV